MKYNAFLSYSHAADNALAPALQSALHRFARPWNRMRALRVFRDKTSLAASPELWPGIVAALADAEYFLLLASPAAAASRWVQREIEWWLDNRSAQKMLILLTEGELVWDEAAGDFDWQRTDALPPLLRGRLATEPLWVDLRWAKSGASLDLRNGAFRLAVLDIAAPLHGRSKDELDGEDVRQFARTRRLVAAAVTTLALLTLTAITAAIFAMRQRDEALRQSNIAQSGRLAALAEATLYQRPRSLPLASLLAVESLKRYPNLEADQFLRQGLPLLPGAGGRLIKHQGPVRAVAFSPDGAHLATASRDGTAAVWEAGGRQVFSLKSDETNPRISAVAFSPTGALLATANDRGIARLWDAGNGQPVGEMLEPNNGPVKAVSFSSDGSYLATVTDRGVDVWEVNAAAKKIFSMSNAVTDPAFPCVPVSSFVFSPSGKHAAVACRGRVRIWDTATWKAVVTIPYKIRPGLRPPLHPIAFSADGKYLASADEVYDVATGTLVHGLYSQWPVSKVAFSHEGDYIALAAGDIVRLVSTSDGVSFAELHHAREIRDVAISVSGRELATASNDNTARIWRVNRDAGDGPSREITRMSHGGEGMSVDFSADEKYLATASEDGTAGLWPVNAERGVAHQVYGGADGSVVAISFTGRFLAVAAADSVQVRETVGGREVGRVAYPDNSEPNLKIAQLSLSPDGRYLWTTVYQKRRRGRGVQTETQKIARVWDASRGKEVARIRYEDIPGAAVFSPDAKHLATEDGTALRIWDVTGNREVARVKRELASAVPVFSADGGYLAIAEPKGIRMLETNGWREVRSLPLPEATFRIAAFSPDGKYIAGGSNENVHIWEVTGGRVSKSLPVRYATAILFAPDGKHIVTANWNFYDTADRSVRIWDGEGQREVGRLQLLEIERAHNVDSSGTQLAFTPDGRYLALENQGTIRIWDTLTRRETERWESQYSTQLVFSPDGKYLLSGHGTSAMMWPWGAAAMIARACDRLGRNLSPEEWRQYLGDEPYRKTCPDLNRAERVPGLQKGVSVPLTSRR